MASETTGKPITSLTWVLVCALVAGAAALVVDSGSARQGPAPPPAQAPEPISAAVPPLLPPLAQGPAPDLDLAVTAQVIGWIEPCG